MFVREFGVKEEHAYKRYKETCWGDGNARYITIVAVVTQLYIYVKTQRIILLKINEFYLKKADLRFH